METLLIDGDLYAFSTAVICQEENPFTGEMEYREIVAKQLIDLRILSLKNIIGTNKILCFFSCNRENNWRKTIVPSYKTNRDNIASPIGLAQLKEYVRERYPTIEEPRLEADDIIGIYATDRSLCKSPVICSYDKDFLTIPSKIYNSKKDIIKKVNKVNAFKAFIYQTIIGDSSDGYKGINRIGPVKAKKFISKHSKTLKDIWNPLIELAEKQGHDEEYLINQARMAHILQRGDYDFKSQKVRLWEPEDIKNML